MRGARPRIALVDTQPSAPQYELRVRSRGPGEDELEVWQVPAPSTPHVRMAVRVAGLRGRNLALVEHRVLRRLAQAGIRLGGGGAQVAALTEPRAYAITERLALTLGLLFRTLAPMRSRENMLRVAEGIEAMGQEEAAYWLGMAMHRSYPRRILSALRLLLTEPAGARAEGR